MKKLLATLGVVTLTSSTAFTVIACKAKAKASDEYFDSEINNIDPTIRNQVKYTSSIAKILIASRHENMNTYGYPTLQYFLNNMGNNLDGTFKTKSGKNIKINDYISEYKKLNNFYYSPWNSEDASYNGENNEYDIMSKMVAMSNLTKWNTNNGHPSHSQDSTGRYNDYEVNSNLGWAQYDTGALANTLSQKSTSVLDYINKTKDWSDYFNSQTGPYASNLLYHNSIKNAPTTSELTYKTSAGDSTTFGKSIANQSSSLYDLFGLKYFNQAVSMLSQFGQGTELLTLSALNQLFPFTQNSESGEKTNGIFMAAPFIILNSLKGDWFDSTGKINSDAPLLQVFSKSTIDDTKLQVEKESDGEVETPDKTVSAMSLYDILNSGITTKATKVIMNGTQQYLDLSTSGHKNMFLKWYAVLANWFDAAIAKEGGTIDLAKFNSLMTKAVQEKVAGLQSLLNFIPVEDTVFALIRTLSQMLQSPNFDMYNLLKGIGGLANWFYTSDDSGHYNLNTANIQKVSDVYNVDQQMAGFNNNLSLVDPKSDYGKLVLKSYGLNSTTNEYDKGTLFDMIQTWAYGGDQSNPNYESMHLFLNQILDSENGYIGQLKTKIDTAMAEDWFDNIFLDKKWNITASGIGTDGTQLGAVIKNGTIIGVRYQLDYYGPKDASTNLERHQKPLGYTDPASGNSPSYVSQVVDKTKRTNIAPEGETWSEQDWIDYDGRGDDYLSDSEKIKYSYVVEFDNHARLITNPNISADSNLYLLSDFNWYYNNNRYY